jgi:hypothetical protein
MQLLEDSNDGDRQQLALRQSDPIWLPALDDHPENLDLEPDEFATDDSSPNTRIEAA